MHDRTLAQEYCENSTMPPLSTIVITGGTGSLGSHLARALEASYPGRFHLLLTCRDTSDSRATSISSFLSSKNSSFSLEKLDLSDLEDVKIFVQRVKSKIGAKEIPSLIGGGLVNSAAYFTFTTGVKAVNGMDVMYVTNCLAPALLTRLLLPLLLEKEGGMVLNIGSAAHELGRIDYFGTQEEGKMDEKLTFVEGMKRYGSSKLLLLMMGHAFQRKLYAVSPILSISRRVVNRVGISW
jgi:NAD(P)-dependent dehydrogenase (short-subunit alcohol dehydrogenase family)